MATSLLRLVRKVNVIATHYQICRKLPPKGGGSDTRHGTIVNRRRERLAEEAAILNRGERPPLPSSQLPDSGPSDIDRGQQMAPAQAECGVSARLLIRQHPTADGTGQIGWVVRRDAQHVDLGNQRVERQRPGLRGAFQRRPEQRLQADRGWMPCNRHGPFDRPRETARRQNDLRVHVSASKSAASCSMIVPPS